MWPELREGCWGEGQGPWGRPCVSARGQKSGPGNQAPEGGWAESYVLVDLTLWSASWTPTEAVAPGTGFSTNSSGGSAETLDGGHWARGP